MRSALFILLALGTALAACRADDATDGRADCATSPASRAYFKTPSESRTMEETLQQIVICAKTEAEAEAWAQEKPPKAEGDLRAMMLRLYQNTPPDPAALASLGPDRLSTVFDPTGKKKDKTTPLNEAVRLKNISWTRALLEAGANPNGLGSKMAFTAVRKVDHPASTLALHFRDYTPSVAFLEAYIAHGGDVNTRAGGGFRGNILLGQAIPNLPAQVFLVQNGADPWLQGKDNSSWWDSSLFGTFLLGSGSYRQNEKFYIHIRLGNFRMPPTPDLHQRMDEQILKVFKNLSGTKGPTNRHDYWAVQKVVEALIEETEYRPPAEVMGLLKTERVPDSEGGWVLREGELYQDHATPGGPATRGKNIW